MADVSQYVRNINRRVDELVREAAEHPDEYVARTLDGQNEVAYAETELALIEKLEGMNRDIGSVVIEEVLPLDETPRMR
jgi:hypothetical protein